MPGPILKNGDQLIWIFDPPLANVIGLPPTITGSGKPTVKSQKMCVESDLKKLEGEYGYTTAEFTAAGSVQMSILPNGAFKTRSAKTGQQPVMLINQASQFDLLFKVKAPASNTVPANDSPGRYYAGKLRLEPDQDSQHISSK